METAVRVTCKESPHDGVIDEKHSQGSNLLNMPMQGVGRRQNKLNFKSSAAATPNSTKT